MKITVGSRGSKLALTQTKWVIAQLKKNFPDVQCEIKVIKTKGDQIQHVALEKIGDKGLFVKEIEQALLKDEIDFAVHSMKDMPSELPDGLIFTDCPEREDSRDVLITPHHIKSLDELPNGAKIGTGSKRRTYQLLKYRNDFQIEGIRGNVDTRIKKMMEQGLDGIILAAAGIHRLGMKSCREYQIIPLSKAVILPAPAQGILAIEVKKERNDLRKMFQVMSDPIATIQSKVERKFLDSVDGSCHIPIGADCRMKEEEIILDGLLGSEDGKILCRKEVKGKIGEKEQLAEQLAKQLIEVVYGDQ